MDLHLALNCKYCYCGDKPIKLSIKRYTVTEKHINYTIVYTFV